MSAPKLTASQQATIRNARRLVAAFEVARTPLEFFGYLGRSPVTDDPAGRAGEAWGYTIGHLRHVLEVVDELSAASTVQCKETSGDGHAVCTRPAFHQGGHRDEDLNRYWPRHDDGSDDLDEDQAGDPGPSEAGRCPETSDGYHCTGWQEGAHRCCACGLAPDEPGTAGE